MDKASYTSASAGLMHLRKLEIVNNNLANVNTPGFKQQFIVRRERAFEETLASTIDDLDPYAKADYQRSPDAVDVRTETDYSVGSIKETGNPLHVAISKPKDFFVVNTPEGPLYTRAGDFTLTGEGTLVTPDGFSVQGDGGEITIQGGTPSISANGSILVDGEQVGRLQVVRFEDSAGLERVNASRFRVKAGGQGPTTLDAPELLPGSLEMSNVSAIESMIDLIAANRGFDMYTKAAKTINEMGTNLISRIGRQ